ncbi:MAG: TetR/AcrR family transcriptional regulator [Spirochaetota bacterium]
MQILKDEVKQAILEAASEEFYTTGYRNSSMRIIAQKADITVGNLYHYFRNKESILDTLLAPVHEKLTSIVDHEIIPVDRIAAEDLRGFVMSEIEKIATIPVRQRREIVILLKRSAGTKYETVEEEIIRYLSDHILEHLSHEGLSTNGLEITITARSIAASFLESILHILQMTEDESVILSAVRNVLYSKISGFIQLIRLLKETQV